MIMILALVIGIAILFAQKADSVTVAILDTFAILLFLICVLRLGKLLVTAMLTPPEK